MGSQGERLPSEEDEITVLVTGFAPFQDKYPINPSWEIASRLPPFLPPSKTAPSNISALADLPPVRILVHPEAIKVCYPVVRELVPKLWEESKKIDYAIHIGMASGRRFYSVERRAHRDGYFNKDVDNELLGDVERREKQGDRWIWSGMPEELLTSVDVVDVWRRWRGALPGADVRISEDAGRYLCDFIFFSSLAHLTKKEEERRVVFFHVPVRCDEESINTGIEVCLELIRAIVQSGRMKKLMSQ
ncbi:hypothetical protein HYFRA_00012860 [Hymenoscyphus fraxineus]|uniref:Peptidase C15, pyroglutamyl peptidase I-like protein n=1 Tax=Hymenoscyphus fraxineus TaxID=746836 RepID=A0A9N9L4S2_9HELO|nr:hypothetical protein HYFRA_00012860 [Hymenoscyphus fraxineus]